MQFASMPFYESPDETHCFQACLRMALGYWLPDSRFTYRQLDRLTGHAAGKWTWQGTALINLAKLGFDIVNIENLNYRAFAEEGTSYLRTIWTKEVFDMQDRFSDLDREQSTAQKLIETSNITLLDNEVNVGLVEKHFRDGFTSMISVNPYALRGEKEYASHMVVAVDFGADAVAYHDPGPPGIRARVSSREAFMKSCTPPAKPDTNLIALRLPR